MSHQRTFFDREFQDDMAYKRLARRDDPITSKLAAQEDFGPLVKLTIEFVQANPGITARELERLSGKELHKRLKECERIGAVRRGANRNCKVTGRLVITWWPVEVTK